MYRWVLIICTLSFFSFNYAKAQNISNEGTDFWAVFPTHDPSRGQNGTSLANVRIYITAKIASEVTVTCGAFSTGTIAIPINTAVPVDIPRASAYIPEAEANGGPVNKGIHIVVIPGREKVAVFEHIYAGARSAASLILPKEALGREYYSMNYTQDFNNNEVSKNFLVLVATDPNTTLIVHKKDGTTFKVNFVNAGEVYEYMPNNQEDMTGVYVEIDPASPDNCNKRFAAYSGSTSLIIGCNGSRDPLFQQLYPVSSWGKNYGTVPFIDRRYIIRILAQQDNTNVQFEGQSITLNKGQFYTSPELINASFVSADKNISVAQYSLTQACSSINGDELIGDPEMVLLNPVEFNVKSTTLFSSDKENIVNRYINVFIKTSATSTFKINGQPVNTVWTAVPSNPLYSYTQIEITDISSYLTANEGFNAVAYGFGAHESYAYSAGTNLAANTYFLVTNKITQRDAQNACIGQESDFKIILPYLVSKITWKLDGGAEEGGPLNPRIIPAADGTLSYEYIYAKNETFNELKPHLVTIKIELLNDGTGCLSEGAEFTYPFDVYPLPTPGFEVEADNCADTEIQFTDLSVSNLPDRPLNKWLWDFGDGTTSTEQHPKHIYVLSGSFEVKLSAGLDEGCMSDVLQKNITVRPKITAKFLAPAIGCINKGVTFQDQSTVEPGTTIVKWYWDFGDGTPPAANATIASPNHSYTIAGKYTVTLITETANGCKSLPFPTEITITDLPKPDFTLPEVCAADDMAEFKNLSADVDGSGAGLTYTWNFGDAGNPLGSTQTIGTHKYALAGIYNVTLTVTNANGCADFVTKPFTVNGSDVRPSFVTINKDNLCSSVKVKFKNTSEVYPLGTVTKLRWYFDVVNRPTEFVEDEDPVLDKEYEFLYPAATSPVPRVIKVRLVAFSGEKCSMLTEEDITLYPSPSVIFDDIPDVCINAGKVQLNQAREAINVPGTGVYSGMGITAEGMFDPAVAGLGPHDITYTFTADQSSCQDAQVKRIIVNPIPQIIVDKDLYILEGGVKKVNANASGSGLTFKWSPATGLDRDDVLNPNITGDEDRTYVLTVSSAKGCSISEQVFVHVIKSIEPANAFSPNGDGINDTWILKYIETYPNTTVDIFNRYGEKVFFSQGYSIPFDGNYKGKLLPVGTYYYMINPKNGRKIITGSLTLIR
jgi:gliding motility-associated-like protein